MMIRGPGSWLVLALLAFVLIGLLFFELRERFEGNREKGPRPP